MNRITGYVAQLEENEIFVFGSNFAGRHGKGAAAKAMDWGAIYGEGEGRMGQTYAIPTKTYFLEPLALDRVEIVVKDFTDYASAHPEFTFLVTEIGCGLAGYTPEQIAPYFKAAASLENVHLPMSFWNILAP